MIRKLLKLYTIIVWQQVAKNVTSPTQIIVTLSNEGRFIMFTSTKYYVNHPENYVLFCFAVHYTKYTKMVL